MSWRPSLKHALLLTTLGSPGTTHGQEPQRAGADTDALLEERISESLAEDLSVDATDIEVRVEDGHIVLGGQVSDAAHRERAERIARSLFGVRSLVNGIR
jgi:osmotically-inducible protein OsmY